MAELPNVIKVSELDRKSTCFSRIDELSLSFEKKYGAKPEFFARAPGRVNLIGEHIDYHGYGVLPMALDQDILIACSTNDSSQIHLANLNSEYPEFDTNLNSFVIDTTKPQWYHYVLCGVKGILENCEILLPRGMKVMLHGQVPRSAGLSSSSAIVCASALMAVYANKKSLSKKDLANICAKSEKYIGTEGGGMDQSISFLAEKGTAKMIDFNPLTATPVQVPKDAVFVVANSCDELNKAATSHFNTRVLEGQLGVCIIAKCNGLDWQSFKKMKSLQEKLGKGFEDLISESKKVLHPQPYTREEICQLLEISDAEFSSSVLSDKTKDLMSFKIYERTMHILTESQRVLQFKHICDEQNESSLQQLGNLMNASHASCRDQYECSSAGLDSLTDVCRKAGALGSRLTGAGWAGCCVSLVPVDIADTFLQKVGEEFYEKRNLPKGESVLFITAPGDGAMIYLA